MSEPNSYDDKFATMVAYKWLKPNGFCRSCGARYPDVVGQGKCKHCEPAFELLEKVEAQHDEM